jgi:glycosyl transferase family 1
VTSPHRGRMHLEVLTEGFCSPNGCAFLFPLVVHRSALARAGITLALRRRASDVRDADAVIVDSKCWRERWGADKRDGIFAELASLRRRADRIVYADTGDSAGWLQGEILPAVDLYWKSLLLRDRRRYLQPIYAYRTYADYYHRRYAVEDARPESSRPVADARDLAKLRPSWNSGLADYTWLGPARMALYERLPLSGLLRLPQRFVPPSAQRPLALHCRMGTDYPRASVACQRRMIAARLAGRLPTAKVSRRRYIGELARSKLVVSPFGFGEITLKDFEVFLAGALLLKPDMSHVETWPDLFRAGETMMTHDWDLADFDAVIERALAEYASYVEVAREGQRRYRRHLTEAAPFVEHLAWLLETDGVRAGRTTG